MLLSITKEKPIVFILNYLWWNIVVYLFNGLLDHLPLLLLRLSLVLKKLRKM